MYNKYNVFIPRWLYCLIVRLSKEINTKFATKTKEGPRIIETTLYLAPRHWGSKEPFIFFFNYAPF